MTVSGDWKKIEKFLLRASDLKVESILNIYGDKGSAALAAATPLDSGETANSWGYEVTKKNGQWRIQWLNRNVNDGVAVAILIQYGHATGTGGFVQAVDYINPALKNIFSGFTDAIVKELNNL